MRIHKALRTTKWSLFTESFHERSWKKRGGLRNLVCFLAVSMIAGAASAQELPIQVKTQSAQRTKTKSTVITTNITDLGEGQYSTNVVTTYAFSLGGLDLADNVNALAVGVYADINGASQSNATYGGVPMGLLLTIPAQIQIEWLLIIGTIRVPQPIRPLFTRIRKAPQKLASR